MTTIEVMQADRDAAADMEEQTINRSTSYTEGMRAGKFDDAPLVQAFARHRQQHATPALIEAGEVLMPRVATRAMVEAADVCTDAYSAYAAMVEAGHVR